VIKIAQVAEINKNGGIGGKCHNRIFIKSHGTKHDIAATSPGTATHVTCADSYSALYSTYQLYWTQVVREEEGKVR